MNIKKKSSARERCGDYREHKAVSIDFMIPAKLMAMDNKLDEILILLRKNELL